MTITAALRVRNEGRWLREVLASIQPVTDDIVLFDDHSTDDTHKIARMYDCEIWDSPYVDGETNETQDKNYLLDRVRLHDPDYCLMIDGDEVLERLAPRAILAKCRQGFGVAGFPIRYVWDDRRHYRADGVYARFQRASMFAVKGQPDTLRFAAGPGGACNFHCGNVPANVVGHGAMIPADILHLGYMDREDRIRKYRWYNEKDPCNGYEDCYRHMVLGDLPEFPATMKRVHGGPLRIFTMPANKWPHGSDCGCNQR